MRIIKLEKYNVLYKGKSIFAWMNVESIDKGKITDLDIDIKSEEMRENLNEIYDELIDTVVSDKIISKFKAHRGIKNGKLTVKIAISYNDLDKCIDKYEYKWQQCKTHEEFFNNYCGTIKYYIEYAKNEKRIRRFERYGALDTKMPFDEEYEYRNELSDYESTELYKVGDIVKLKYPVRGISEGVIVSVLHGVTTLRCYEVGSLDNKSLIWDDDKLHHDDIEEVICHDINKAYEFITTHGSFTEEYVSEVKQMVEDESK